MSYILMLLLSICTTSGQILVKKGINRKMYPFYLDPLIISGGLLVMVAPLIYIQVLKLIGLSNAYGLNGISYIMIYIFGIIFLKEGASKQKTIGIILITTGVLIWSL